MVKVRPILFASVLALSPFFGTIPSVFAETAPQSPTADVISAGPVNINAASVQELAAKLNGIGEKKAEAIVAYRDANGPFTTVDQLLQVGGIGQATLDRNRDIIRVE